MCKFVHNFRFSNKIYPINEHIPHSIKSIQICVKSKSIRSFMVSPNRENNKALTCMHVLLFYVQHACSYIKMQYRFWWSARWNQMHAHWGCRLFYMFCLFPFLKNTTIPIEKQKNNFNSKLFQQNVTKSEHCVTRSLEEENKFTFDCIKQTGKCENFDGSTWCIERERESEVHEQKIPLRLYFEYMV